VIWTLLWSASAFAQGQADRVGGEPEFSNCVDNADCYGTFLSFLSSSMSEQGFSMAQHGTLINAGLPANGVLIGGQLDTFPLNPPRSNLAGKEENTSFSPVLPKIPIGARTDVGEARLAGGLFFTPPFKVQGASALVLGGEASMAWVAGDKLHVGPEVSFTFVEANAPIAATPDQAASSPGNVKPETYAAVCEPKPNGCIDTFTLMEGSARAAFTWDVGQGFHPFGKVGVGWTHQRLHIEYDDTTWRLRGVQPHVQAGIAARHQRLEGAISTAMAPRWAHLSEGAGGLFFKLQAAGAVRF